MIRIGIDLGGTKIEAIAMDPAGAIVERLRVPAPQTYRGCLKAIADLVAAIEREHGKGARVGIGHPGSISPATGLMRNANSIWLNGEPFARDIEGALARPVRLANDADCFTLSEAVDGAGEGAGIVFGIILGTGVGGGIAIDGQLLRGAQGIAGEWGHNPLPWPNESDEPAAPCWCGQSGCHETWLSGPGLARDHASRNGGTLSAAEIFAAAESGDAPARLTVDLHGDRLARGIASVLNILDADVVVLGGGVSNAPGLAQRVTVRLPDFLFSDTVRTRILIHRHGDSSGVRGAAWLWPVESAQAP
ncbi:ROK family protein [uncultured Maricaulis sp.]|uniref:ROK family protein n=1 Tax=uncultured Maricaulis sp. TaxID=174710 RepID=UPI0030DA152C|tara:strand:- start:15435 stop:16349 length:915 start_codon:yes stop_codon:yes gene_type:complete